MKRICNTIRLFMALFLMGTCMPAAISAQDSDAANLRGPRIVEDGEPVSFLSSGEKKTFSILIGGN